MKRRIGLAIAFFALATAGCEVREIPGGSAGEGTQASDSAAAVEQHLAIFDTLDFDVFSNQKWDRLHESHAADIVVTWPDGHETVGIEQHIEDLRAMFVAIPDLRITEHPIRIGNGSWTAVTGVMTGTFTGPMPMPDGTTVPPTGNSLNMSMVTIGHWNDAGVMDHEWLYWDQLTFLRQLGLAE